MQQKTYGKIKENATVIKVSPRHHRFLNLYAAQNGISMKEALEKLIEDEVVFKVKRSIKIDSDGYTMFTS